MEARSRNHCCCGEVIIITNSKYVSVALDIQHAGRMRLIIVSSVAHPDLPHFSTLSHKRHDFGAAGGGGVLNGECFLIFSTNFV
jgi:hypothetical protein